MLWLEPFGSSLVDLSFSGTIAELFGLEQDGVNECINPRLIQACAVVAGNRPMDWNGSLPVVCLGS